MQELKLASKKTPFFWCCTSFSILSKKKYPPVVKKSFLSEDFWQAEAPTPFRSISTLSVRHVRIFVIWNNHLFNADYFLKYLLSACLLVPISGTSFRLDQWEKLSLEESLSKVVDHCFSSTANEKMHVDSVTQFQWGTSDAVEMPFSSCQEWRGLYCLRTVFWMLN